MKGACTILMLIWICNSGFSQQQYSLSHQISFAASLAESGNNESALKEYLRAYYLDRDNVNVRLPYTISQLFRYGGDYKNALLFVEKYLYQNTLDLKQRQDGVYEKVTLLMSSGLYKEAQFSLISMSQELKKNRSDKYQYFLSMCYVFSGQYEKAKRTLNKLSYIDQPNEIFAINMLVDKLETIQKTDHRKARYLSIVLPGLGQAVNGEYEDGLNSLALIAGLTVVFFEVSSVLNWVDAAVSVGPWWARYYVGGMQNANRASQKKMINRTTEEIQVLNEYLKRKKVN